MQNYLTLNNLFYLTLGLLIFLLTLLFWLWRTTRHYNSLIKNSDKKTLSSVLEGIQKTLSAHEKKTKSLRKDLEKLEQNARLHLQDIQVKRFNPFSDTGGDQSFILSILDDNKDGIIITSLHSRENTRFYVKSVKGGAGEDHPLSEEEQKIVNKRKR